MTIAKRPKNLLATACFPLELEVLDELLADAVLAGLAVAAAPTPPVTGPLSFSWKLKSLI